jgi:hypothetical protein
VIVAQRLFDTLTCEYVDLEDFRYGSLEVSNFSDVCRVVSELKKHARVFGDIILNDGSDFGVPYIHVLHSKAANRVGKVSVYDDDDDPNYGISAALQEWWYGDEEQRIKANLRKNLRRRFGNKEKAHG